ncbi:MAG TPA: penicillin-binding protein [Tissierellales bacterium]|jgi:penicillin-binding protein 2|uniref:penicillin-binding transpeptidase domain-containing protein n=1 Tax=Gudongella oleilytica TaxID=1582259 RepID=UPI000EC52A05|nr:penicillin-binding transpeptidase domain-containing protein [Gudongella oleilytica]MDY0255585.1 penicillin-binding transpeptidase domain-containing protein [Gudongella oleilytica]HCO18976.1 penicillin-binding protein [Tissierellales bacterium]
MKLSEKIFNRYNLMIALLVLIMLALIFKLATLTLAQGDYYRDLSDNKRVKEVFTTAPRGEIRDRYGRLLAGNIPSFTVQLLKDELNIKDKELRNSYLIRLVRFLEEDGVPYNNDYPIQLNIFEYSSIDLYMANELSPEDTVITALIENGLLIELMGKQLQKPYQEHFQLSMYKRGLDAIADRGISTEGLSYDSPDDGSIVKVVQILESDRTLVRKMIDHPIARELAFGLLEEKGLESGVILKPYSLSFQTDYLNQKIALMKQFPFVTMNTTAKQDFINLFIEVSLESFLQKIITTGDETGERLVPAQILIDMLKAEGIDSAVKLQINEDREDVLLSISGESSIISPQPVRVLINEAAESGVLEKFITDPKIIYQAQAKLISDGVNPRISVSGEIEYVHINNLNNWYSGVRADRTSELEDIFKELKQKNNIPENLSKYETIAVLGLLNQLTIQGYLAYQPINVAYGIKDSTVAKIEEELSQAPGIKVSIEPVRFYPEGSTAAHVLGYIGKISQPNEIEKYIRNEGYSPGTLIGKTGIEESFELHLRGQSGVKKVEVDVIGNTTNVLEEIKPIPGNTLYLTLDLKLQQVAEEALKKTLDQLSKGGTYESKWGNYTFGIQRRKNRPYINATSGAVVVIDVKTGETLAMASYPAYDPNLFSTGISNPDWLSLFPEDTEDPLAPRPLYNIATQTAIQPGSTFKMVTGLAALEKGLNPLLRIRDMGYVTVGNKNFHCLIYTSTGGTHGYENFYEALRDSCNYYFYTLALGRNQRTGQNIGVKLEIEDIVETSKKLGLNDKTGVEINVPAEVSGGVPDPQRKIITTKYLLKQMLQRTISGYIMEDKDLTAEDIDTAINEIISWTDMETPMTRGEVVRRLTEMGIEPELRLPGEREGLADKIKYTYLNQAGWNIADTLNVTIGQGQSAYTPIQMANYIATIANGGYLNKVTLIESIRDYSNSAVLYEHRAEGSLIELNNYENLDHVKKGMQMVAEDGTARRVFSGFPIEVGVKTGTAERSGINPSTGDTYDDFAWFVGFAPFDEPEIAVATVIFQGGSGGYAAPMVRDIIAQYLGLNTPEVQTSLPIEGELILD